MALAVIRKASLMVATSDGQPYISLMRAIASLSCSSKRIVVADSRGFFSVMPQYYHIDIHAVKCYILGTGQKALCCPDTGVCRDGSHPTERDSCGP